MASCIGPERGIFVVMSETPQDDVFGLITTDRFGGWITLRQFTYLADFASQHSPGDDPRVTDWQNHIAELATEARSFTLRAQLHRLGVHELDLSEGLPTPKQKEIFNAFVENEQTYCDRVVDALTRYYGAVRDDWDALEDDEKFANPSRENLASLVEFDSLVVTDRHLNFTMRPAWDTEHGMGAIMYQGQVVMVGSSDDIGEFTG
ncbi:MAG: hypothetical protein AAGD32_09585 [Planctomycetota bacterium]